MVSNLWNVSSTLILNLSSVLVKYKIFIISVLNVSNLSCVLNSSSVWTKRNKCIDNTTNVLCLVRQIYLFDWVYLQSLTNVSTIYQLYQTNDVY